MAIAIAAIVAATGGSIARAADERPQEAKEAFASGHYREALDLFVKLYAETLDPIYLRVIGRCYQKLEDPDRAIDAFQEYLRKARKISPDKRKEIDRFIAEMEALRERQHAQGQAAAQPPSGAGAPGAPPPGGAATASSGSPSRQPPSTSPSSSAAASSPARGPLNLEASPGTAMTSDAPALIARDAQPSEPTSAPVYKRWWFWTAVGVTATAGIVTAIVMSKRDDPGAPYMGGDGVPLLPPGTVNIPSR